MLPKQYRLKKRSAFKATYKVKNSSHSGGVTLFAGILKKEDSSANIHSEESAISQTSPANGNNIYPTRTGFVVSKKVHKRAVKRNRLKRLMREAYRLLLKENNLGNSQKYMSLVFVGTENALNKSFAEIQKSIKKLIERL